MMSTVEVDVSIEERMVTVDRGPPSKSAKYKLLLTFGLPEFGFSPTGREE